MTTNNPTEYYNNAAQAARRETVRLSRQVALVSWTRLAVVLLAIGGAWCFWGDTQVVATLIASCVVLFLLLVKLHNRLFAALEMQRALEQVAADNLQRIALDLNDLDGGEEYIDARHPYRTCSVHGRFSPCSTPPPPAVAANCLHATCKIRPMWPTR